MKNIYIITFFGIVTALPSCKLPQPLSKTSEKVASDSEALMFLNDSVNTGSKPRHLFFTDTVLQNLIDAAVANNFELLQANQQLRMAEVIHFVNGALNRPTLDATINAQADRFGFYTMNGIGNYDMNKSQNVTPEMRVPDPVPDLMVGLRSMWEIDVWGRLKNLKNMALQNMKATEAERQWLTTQLVGEIGTLYYEWSALTYEQEVLNRNIQLQEAGFEIVQALKTGGRATELAVQQFKAQVFRTRALRHQLARQIIEAESRIHYLCGRFPGKIGLGTPIMQQPLPDVLQTGIPSRLLEQRPDISAALYRLSAAYEQSEAARKAFLPSFTIAGYLGFQGFRLPAFFNAESITAGLAGNALAPLLQRRQIRGQYALSAAEHEMAWLEYKKRVRIAAMEVYNSLKGMETLSEQFQLKEKELEALKTAVKTANELYINGFANYLEVITAQQSLLEADLELVQLRRSQMQYIIQLYRSTGGGWQ